MTTHHWQHIADHVSAIEHNIKWDHFVILSSGNSDYHCKLKKTLFIQDLSPTTTTTTIELYLRFKASF